MLGILTFIIIFGVIVVVHEFGHFYFAKKSGILVREFAIGMGPKIFSHIGQDGTLYTIRILPLGGYVRMAGWGDDKVEIKTGTPASLTLNQDSVVIRINLSQKKVDTTSLPMNVTSYDLEDKLTIAGLVIDETKTYQVDHDATIVEEDGSEVRIAPLDVQYQNASVWGRLITNFAGPMNNFILGSLVFVVLIFSQGGVLNTNSNVIRVDSDSPIAKAGVKDNDKILSINQEKISNWNDIVTAIGNLTDDTAKSVAVTIEEEDQTKELTVTPNKVSDSYVFGLRPALKTGFIDKILGGFQMAWSSAFAVINGLKNLIAHFSLNQLGGPVAIYQLSNQAAQSGILDVLYLLGMLSINLGIMNLIPIPALDGGKIVINIIEAIRRKPLKQEIETYVTIVGVAIMFILMVAVTWNDIMRVFF